MAAGHPVFPLRVDPLQTPPGDILDHQRSIERLNTTLTECERRCSTIFIEAQEATLTDLKEERDALSRDWTRTAAGNNAITAI